MSVAREPGVYWVKLPWGPWTLAEWRKNSFWLFSNPTPHEPEYFSEIGPCIIDQLQTVVTAFEAPTWGNDDAFHDNLFDAIDPIREFLKNALH